MKIVVGVDGSDSGRRAVEWTAEHAGLLGAEVIAVHAVEEPAYFATPMTYYPIPPMSEEARAQIRDLLEHDWCAPFVKQNVPVRALLEEGPPARVLMEVAAEEDADLVVCGRRGRGGFAELLLGSTSHQLAHHLRRPLLIVP
jgi:nucleotide-binding universal stress UspA family protein